jgi:hypothetical protein
MTIPSRYFHSRSVLLFLIINSVLVLIGSLLVLFRLDSGTTTNYIIEYRANYGIGEYERGFALDMAGFIFFLLLNFAICVFLSLRTFPIRRHIAVAVLVICSLLNLLTIIVSNALMALR